MQNCESADLIAAVYQAYSIAHPEADSEKVETWDEALNSEETPSAVMEAYSEICTLGLLLVLEDPELVDGSTFDIVAISVAAGYYEAASRLTKQLEDVRRVAKEALIGDRESANDLDGLLADL